MGYSKLKICFAVLAIAISGCTLLSSPESTLRNFYSNIDSGNYDVADKLTVGDGKLIVAVARPLFGENGKNADIKIESIKKIRDENPENFKWLYGNVEDAARYNVKITVYKKLKISSLEIKPAGTFNIPHLMLKIDGEWKIASGALPNF